jgi:hypothetical protein
MRGLGLCVDRLVNQSWGSRKAPGASGLSPAAQAPLCLDRLCLLARQRLGRTPSSPGDATHEAETVGRSSAEKPTRPACGTRELVPAPRGRGARARPLGRRAMASGLQSGNEGASPTGTAINSSGAGREPSGNATPRLPESEGGPRLGKGRSWMAPPQARSFLLPQALIDQSINRKT